MAKHKHAGNIRKVIHLLEKLDRMESIDQSHAHVRCWFRGHGDESWDLAPGVYRSDFPVTTEEQRLELEQRLTQDYRVMSAGIRTGDEGEAELYFLQQHYRMKTRLLDWTNNPLAALYFAASSKPDKDGALFVMDAYQLGPSQKGKYTMQMGIDKYITKEFRGIADSRHPVFQDALHVIFWWDGEKTFPDFIFPVRPDYFDPRITLQRGCFTFHVPNRGVLSENENPTLKSYVVPSQDKPEILRQLAILGVDDFSIFGDLEHLSNRLKAAYSIR